MRPSSTTSSPNPQESRRNQRHGSILTLVSERQIRSQAELQRLLASQRIRVNQATLSRDLRDLGIAKSPNGYRQSSSPDRDSLDEFTRTVRDWLASATPAQNQVVLKTPPAGSQPLALAIDRAGPDGVVGTIAGDDTVLVICTDQATAKRFAKSLLARHEP